MRHEIADEGLRIIDEALWTRVKQRQARQSYNVGAAVARGIAAGRVTHSGRGPKYLLSGIMVCSDCGRPMNMVSKLAYSCPAYHDGGPAACANAVLINRVVAEGKLLRGVKNQFLSPANVERLTRKVRRLLAERQATAGPERRALEAALAEQDRIIANIVEAIASAPALKAPRYSASARGARGTEARAVRDIKRVSPDSIAGRERGRRD